MKRTLLAFAIAVAFSGCNNSENYQDDKNPASTVAAKKNPLLQSSQLQYQTPDFSKINNDQFEQAFLIALTEHEAEIADIANNTEPATFENTILAFEQSGQALAQVAAVFYHFAGTIADESINKTRDFLAPKMAANSDNIYLNPALFARVKTVHDNLKQLDLDTESKRLVDVVYDDFVRSGALLNAKQNQIMRSLNQQEAELRTTFEQKLFRSRTASAVYFEKTSELDGLPTSELAILEANAKEAGHSSGYLVYLVNTTRQPIINSMTVRASRERIWQASAQRMSKGEQDSSATIKKLISVRTQKANLLGFDTWADYQLDAGMASTPETAFELLDSMVPAVVNKVQSQAAEINQLIKQQGGDFTVKPWDWAFYANQLKAQKFNISEDAVKQYFEFNNVLEKGAFYALEKQFGITFKRRLDIPTYAPDVLVYEVFDKQGESLAIFFGDYFAREGKGGGAWMGNLRNQSKLFDQKPVIYNVMSIPKGANNEPTYVSFDNVTTIFHELGHGVHGIFSDVQYASLSGANTTSDAGEFPSTYQEDWAVHPDVLAHYAINNEGEVIPAATLTKLRAAANYSQGFDTLEYLSAALLDLEWHSIPSNTPIDSVAEFEQQALRKHGIDLEYVPPRYKSNYFDHIFPSGYSAGYYAYLWSEILAADAFAFVRDNGGLNTNNGEHFRETILSVGNTLPMAEAYRNFKGSDATTDALLERRGLK